MIGTCNFKRAIAVLVGSAGLVVADQITLNGDARLSGTVRSISGEGVVELATPLAPGPVLLKGESVRKVTFSDAAEAGKIPSSRVELTNGDLLPVEVESLDEDQLNVISPVAGRLQIARNAVKSLQLGIHPSRVIYAGPNSLEDLKPEGQNADNWGFDEGVLSIAGEGKVSKKLPAADQFIARFTMAWENNPAFWFSFADPLALPQQAVDRYVFQFTAAGIEIKRESTKGKRLTSIITLNRRPDQYPAHRLKVEIRVDRGNSLLHLFLNDEPEGRYSDPTGEPPTGGGIAFMSTAGNQTEFRLSNIEILEWDHDGDRYRTEDRGDPKTDALIEKRGDRFGGRLISIRKAAEGPVFVFKSDFQDAPIELPESEVSTVFFQQPEAAPPGAFHPFALRLRGDGVLRVSTCSFPGDRIEAVHPLLGALTFSRNGVTALERLQEKGGKP